MAVFHPHAPVHVPPTDILNAHGRCLHVAAGIAAGSIILTAEGSIPVEFLCPGDRIITRNTGMVRVAAIESRPFRGDFVKIQQGTLGDLRPDSDTILAADQQLLLRGKIAIRMTGQPTALFRVGNLPAGPGIVALDNATVTLVQLIFHSPQIVYADGLELLCLQAGQASLAA